MNAIDRHHRRGVTLPELLIAMTIVVMLGHSLTRLLLSQARFFSQQDALRSARTVSRGATNLLFSDLRMVEPTWGIVAAADSGITIRVPFAMGIVCNSTTVSLLPIDSVMSASGGFSGYAWRDSVGNYVVAESGTSTGAGNAANCTGASITTVTGGRVISVSPAMPAAARVGAPVLLFRRMRYAFRPSTAMPGQIALWRISIADDVAEEMIGPFDAAARFRFYDLNRDTAQTTVPSPLSNIRGLELRLTGLSEAVPRGAVQQTRAMITTAVFFKNRMR